MNPLLIGGVVIAFALLLSGGKKRKKVVEDFDFAPPPDIDEDIPLPPPPVVPPLKWDCPNLAPNGDGAVCEIQKEINGHLDSLGYETIPENGLVDGRLCGANRFLADFGDMPLMFDCEHLGIDPIWPLLKYDPVKEANSRAALDRMIIAYQDQCDNPMEGVAAAKQVFEEQASIRQYDVGLMAAEGELFDRCVFSWS